MTKTYIQLNSSFLRVLLSQIEDLFVSSATHYEGSIDSSKLCDRMTDRLGEANIQ
jgi:hypothetical protein